MANITFATADQAAADAYGAQYASGDSIVIDGSSAFTAERESSPRW